MKLKQTLKSVCHISLLKVIIILIASGIVVMTHYAYDIESGSFCIIKILYKSFSTKIIKKKEM